jgi:hypothetical protein
MIIVVMKLKNKNYFFYLFNNKIDINLNILFKLI